LRERLFEPTGHGQPRTLPTASAATHSIDQFMTTFHKREKGSPHAVGEFGLEAERRTLLGKGSSDE
jgi:hypothetical protein